MEHERHEFYHPTQSGIASQCSGYVLQGEGVYCYDIAQAAGISLHKRFRNDLFML
jgi:hypothetical protein